jgi:hypothetical protein
MHVNILQKHAPPRLVSGWNFAEEVSVLELCERRISCLEFCEAGPTFFAWISHPINNAL